MHTPISKLHIGLLRERPHAVSCDNFAALSLQRIVTYYYYHCFERIANKLPLYVCVGSRYGSGRLGIV